MDRLFLDANVLFSAAYRVNARLRTLWKLKDVALCSSHYAVEEARANLADQSQKSRLMRLLLRVELFDTAPREIIGGIRLPEKDVPILLGAIEARATHLMSGDLQHFGLYFGKRIEGILVVSPSGI
jgi:predicted nucleic acid-binding protein